MCRTIAQLREQGAALDWPSKTANGSGSLMTSLLRSPEEPVLRFFKFAILAMLAIALAATLVSLVLGLSRYVQTPDGVVHARKPPKAHAVSSDEFLEKLGSEGVKASGEAPAATTDASDKATEPEAANRRFAEEVQTMLKCERSFDKKIGREQPEPDAAAVEAFRAQFEKVAMASPERGEPWAGDVSQFVCATLDERDATNLGKNGKLDQPLVAAINFHIAKWDEGRRKLHEFEVEDKRRVEREARIEAQRVQDARASVGSALTAAGVSFAIFLAIAFCLILSAIESNLRAVRDALELMATREPGLLGAAPAARQPPAPSAPSVPVSAASYGNRREQGPINLTEIALEDPLEVEYRIPDESLSRS
jgi:hypothetical protein